MENRRALFDFCYKLLDVLSNGHVILVVLWSHYNAPWIIYCVLADFVVHLVRFNRAKIPRSKGFYSLYTSLGLGQFVAMRRLVKFCIFYAEFYVWRMIFPDSWLPHESVARTYICWLITRIIGFETIYAGITTIVYISVNLLYAVWFLVYFIGAAIIAVGSFHVRDARSLYPLQYPYTTLKVGEIRLLRIHPRLPFRPVKAELIVVGQQQSPPYDAISYHWGTIGKTREIILDDIPVRLNRAAYEAIADTTSMWKTRLIWIDSICINQDDLQEKAIQVAQMIDVYKNAERVIVALKRPTIYREVVEVLVTANTLLMAWLWNVSPILVAQDVSGASVNWTKPYYWKPAFFDTYLTFWSQAWFTRVWVLQEVSVARDVFFSYSGFLFHWDWFRLLHESTTHVAMELAIKKFPSGRMAWYNLASFAAVLQLRSITQQRARGIVVRNWEGAVHPKGLAEHLGEFYGGSSGVGVDTEAIMKMPLTMTFPHLLTSYGDFGATDARDKIFALRGLVLDGLTASSKPDYHKSVEVVYQDLAMDIWMSSEPFELVGWSGIGFPRVLHLPSVVPDWTYPVTKTCRPLTSASRRLKEVKLGYKASGNTGPEVRLVQAKDERYLRVAGVLVGRVDMLTLAAPIPEQHTATSDPELGIEILIAWHNDARDLAARHAYFSTQEEFEETFWRTLLCDMRIPLHCGTLDMRQVYAAWLEFTRKWKAGYRDFGAENRIPFDAPSSRNWLRVIGPPTGGRRFGITEHGQMAMFPPLTHIGDVVCIAYGASTPWVLRPTANPETEQISGSASERCYQLVGECYVHGIMDGELIMNGEQETDYFRLW